jgi:hypothetical protein
LSPIPHSHQYIGQKDKKNQKRNFRINETIIQIKLSDIYKIFHQTAIEYTFFSGVYETSPK